MDGWIDGRAGAWVGLWPFPFGVCVSLYILYIYIYVYFVFCFLCRNVIIPMQNTYNMCVYVYPEGPKHPIFMHSEAESMLGRSRHERPRRGGFYKNKAFT